MEERMIQPNSSFPVFIVKQLDAAKVFYTTYLGFSAAFENAWYLHLATETGIQVGFMLPDQPTQPDIFHNSFSGPGVIFSLEVDDVDAAYSEATTRGLTIVLSLRSEDWGQRHFCVQDPNGIYLDIVQAIAPTDAYKAGYTDA
jgi:catechol 2,3-dioxygenase-like lactoylglutathione lyase family enzyme